jgi:hypothetical protein
MTNYFLLKLKWLVKKNELSVVFGIIFIIAFSLILLKIFIFKPIPTYNASDKAFRFLTSNPEQTAVVVSGISENTCFWITPSYNGTNYILKIREYDSPTKDCIGKLVNKLEIVIDNPANIIGNTSCICGGKEYLIKKLSEGGLTNFNILIK